MPDTATPGAVLSPLDRLIDHTESPNRAPDETGKAYGFVYAIWQVRPLDSNRVGKFRVFVADAETGELVPGTQYQRHLRGPMEQAYHWTRTLEKARQVPCRMYFRRRFDPDQDPLKSLQVRIRSQTEKKVQHRYQEARRRRWKREDRKAAARFHSKPVEKVTKSDVQAMRKAANDLAEGSFAH